MLRKTNQRKMLLTHSECELILERYGAKNKMTQIKLKDFEMKPATQVIGYLGDYYQLTIYFYSVIEDKQVQVSLQLFVKTVPQASEEPAKEMIFRKESYLYEHLLGDLQNYSSHKWSPTCYYSRSDLLVLEDLNCLGYSTIKGNFIDLQMSELLLAMSCMHAASFIYEHKKGTPISTHFIEILQEITVSPKIAWFTTGLRAILDILALHPNYQTEWHKQFISSQLEKILTKVYDKTNASKKYNNVLCHRDLWAANILFKQNLRNDGNDAIKPAILVDYQTCRYAPPSVDLVFAIYLNLSKLQRNSDELKYLNLYYKFLIRNLADFNLNIADYLTKEQLLDSYNDLRLIGAVYRAVVMTVIKVPKEVVTNDYKYVDRYPVISSLMKNCDNFRNCMFECAEDVMELALKFLK